MTQKGHWTQEVAKGFTAFADKRCFRLSLRRLSALGWTYGEERHLSPFVPTLCHWTRIGQSKPVFQWISGSLYQAYLDPRCSDVDSKPVSEPSAFDHSKAMWRGIVAAPEVQIIGKESRGRYTRRTPPPCPLRTNAYEARYQPARVTLSALPTNFAPAEGWTRTTPRGCGRVRHSSRRELPGESYLSKHPAEGLSSSQNWSWLLLSVRTLQPSSSRPLYPSGRTQRQW